MKKYEIYVGLNDKDTGKEKLTSDDFARILSEICANRKIGFTMSTQFGGYAHNQGYVVENSLKVTLLNIEEEQVEEIGRILKERINTDTIMITSEDCMFYYR